MTLLEKRSGWEPIIDAVRTASISCVQRRVACLVVSQRAFEETSTEIRFPVGEIAWRIVC